MKLENSQVELPAVRVLVKEQPAQQKARRNERTIENRKTAVLHVIESTTGQQSNCFQGCKLVDCHYRAQEAESKQSKQIRSQ